MRRDTDSRLCIIGHRLVLIGLVFVWAHPAVSADPVNSCADLSKTTAEDEILEITVSPAGGTAMIRTARANCRESLKELGATLPVPAASAPKTEPRKTVAAKSAPPAPLEAATPEPPAPTARRPMPWEKVDTCIQLGEKWKAGTMRVGPYTYALARAYTIDRDNDSIVDDVSFVLESREAPPLVIRYDASPGVLSAKMLPGLRLDDDSLIRKLCFGNQQFEIAKEEAVAKPLFRLPDLAAEARAKEAKPKKAAPAKSAPISTSQILMAVGFFGGASLIGGAVAFVLYRRRTASASEIAEAEGNEGEDEEATDV